MPETPLSNRVSAVQDLRKDIEPDVELFGRS